MITQFRVKWVDAFFATIKQPNEKTDQSLFNSTIVPEHNIGIIRINNSLAEKKLVKEFKKVLEEMQSTQALIIDLRNTIDGGNTSVAEPIMSMFVHKKQPYQLYENHKKNI